MIFHRSGVVGRPQAVVKEGDVPVSHPAGIVLLDEIHVLRADGIDELELVVLSAQTPDDLAGLAVDLGHLIQVAARQQQMAVAVTLNGIAMHVVNAPIEQAFGGVGDGNMVEAAPLEGHVAALVEFLYAASHHGGVCMTAGHDLAHVHLALLVDEEEDVPIGQKLEIVEIGAESVGRRHDVHDVVGSVHDLVPGRPSNRVREQAIHLFLEILGGHEDPLVIDQLACTVHNEQVRRVGGAADSALVGRDEHVSIAGLGQGDRDGDGGQIRGHCDVLSRALGVRHTRPEAHDDDDTDTPPAHQVSSRGLPVGANMTAIMATATARPPRIPPSPAPPGRR